MRRHYLSGYAHPLRRWFYEIYLLIAARHGVPGKELQRTLGMIYKTAWRIDQQVRKLMDTADPNEARALRGHVELDEAYVGVIG